MKVTATAFTLTLLGLALVLLLPSPADATKSPVVEKATQKIEPSDFLRGRPRGEPSRFHSRTVPSKPADARRSPCGENATEKSK